MGNRALRTLGIAIQPIGPNAAKGNHCLLRNRLGKQQLEDDARIKAAVLYNEVNAGAIEHKPPAPKQGAQQNNANAHRPMRG